MECDDENLERFCLMRILKDFVFWYACYYVCRFIIGEVFDK